MKFAKGDSVLCYHGQLLYDAKIMECHSHKHINRYYIHYIGWNSKRWDQWVDEEQVLEKNKENLKKEKELKLASKSSEKNMKESVGHAGKQEFKNLKFKKVAFKKSVAKRKVPKNRKRKPLLRVSVKHLREDPASYTSASTLNKSDIQPDGDDLAVQDTSVDGPTNFNSCEITESDIKPGVIVLDSLMSIPNAENISSIHLQKTLEQNKNSDVNSTFPRVRKKLTARMSTGGKTRRPPTTLATRSKTQHHSCRPIPVENVEETEKSQKETEKSQNVKVILPFTKKLQRYLEKDNEYIRVQNKVMKLPDRFTVDFILKDYMEKRKENEALSQNTSIGMGEFVRGVKAYFNDIVQRQLLYNEETAYYEEIMNEHSGKCPAQLFGVIHLIRLLTKLDKLIKFRPYDELTANVLTNHFRSLVRYLSDNAENFISASDYS